MTKISRYRLSPRQKRKFIAEFWRLVSSFRNSKEAAEFLENFLTPAETVIFAKRWQALKMLSRRKSYREIANVLKMSSTTLSRMANRLRDKEEFGKAVLARL